MGPLGALAAALERAENARASIGASSRRSRVGTTISDARAQRGVPCVTRRQRRTTQMAASRRSPSLLSGCRGRSISRPGGGGAGSARGCSAGHIRRCVRARPRRRGSRGGRDRRAAWRPASRVPPGGTTGRAAGSTASTSRTRKAACRPDGMPACIAAVSSSLPGAPGAARRRRRGTRPGNATWCRRASSRAPRAGGGGAIGAACCTSAAAVARCAPRAERTMGHRAGRTSCHTSDDTRARRRVEDQTG